MEMVLFQLAYGFDYITLWLLQILSIVESLPPPSLLEELLFEFLEGTHQSVDIILRKGVVHKFDKQVVLSVPILNLPSHLVIQLELFLDHQFLLSA
jgi:hypothetical protein